jgi:hypothetical protein
MSKTGILLLVNISVQIVIIVLACFGLAVETTNDGFFTLITFLFLMVYIFPFFVWNLLLMIKVFSEKKETHSHLAQGIIILLMTFVFPLGIYILSKIPA